MRQWTKQQLDAIEGRGGTLLVSAAAGSGKTSVLVERIVRRVTDPLHPCDVDRLLVVTFTRLAAAEMKERLAEELGRRLTADPHNSHLYRQQMLLPKANICTIDSFCSDLVRDHFHLLDISPDYRIADGGELELMQQEVMAQLLEEEYRKESQPFLALVEQFENRRGDVGLEEVIRQLYDYAEAYPFPQQVLEGFAAMYRAPSSVAQSPWGGELMARMGRRFDYLREINRQAMALCEQDALLTEKYLPSLQEDGQAFEELCRRAQGQDWEALRHRTETLTLCRLGMVRGYADHPVKNAVAALRKTISDQLKQIKSQLVASEEEHRQDMTTLAPLADCLVKLVRRYSDLYFDAKKESNCYGFGDIEHFAVRLLCRMEEGEAVPTPVARELSEGFEEILIDEYQDTNECQDMLFRCLSRQESNLFMVGDVKQSIYRFRKAMPQIFLRRRNAFPPYEENRYPASVTLGENFRSREGVTEFVNFLFRQLMTPEIGDMFYGGEEELRCGGSFPEKDVPDVEVRYVLRDTSEEGDDRFVREASYAAGRIAEMVSGGQRFWDGKAGKERRYRYSDFCVILRKMAGGCAKVYLDAFQKAGIPCRADFSDSFFDAQEVSDILSLLTVLDNPLLDIPLLAVLLSPLVGFTPDETAELRMRLPGVPLYHALQRCGMEGDKKCARLLEQLLALRRLSVTLPVSLLIRRVCETTGYFSVAAVLPGGGQRRANLLRLMEYADSFEGTGGKGLTGFLRFLNRLQERGKDLPGGGGTGDHADAVQIMTIHKSKGLEFPVCFLGCLSQDFNKKSLDKSVLLQGDLGIGLKCRDAEKGHTFKTIPYLAVRNRLEEENLSEELRCLYVAMTRAREQLICLIELPGLEKKLSTLWSRMAGDNVLSPVFVGGCGSPGDWITAALLRHPDGGLLRQGLPGELALLPSSQRVTISAEEEGREVLPPEETAVQPPDPSLREELSHRLNFVYPYGGLSRVLAKRSASEFSLSPDHRYFAAKRPAFLQPQGLTSAQKGTAMHKFAQYADYRRASADLEGEIAALVASGRLTEREGRSLHRPRLSAFVDSPLVERILASPKVLREKRFFLQLPLRELYPDVEELLKRETMLVQGVADLVFEEGDSLVIVDYKNDFVKEETALVEKYREQLRIYHKAFSRIFERPVSGCSLYSFALGREIPLIFED